MSTAIEMMFTEEERRAGERIRQDAIRSMVENRNKRQHSYGSSDTAVSKRTRPNDASPSLYNSLPAPTTEFVELRFQLESLKGVFRVAQLPLTFTFANLHKCASSSPFH